MNPPCRSGLRIKGHIVEGEIVQAAPTIAGAIAKALAAYPLVLPIVGAGCVIEVVYLATRPGACVSFLW